MPELMTPEKIAEIKAHLVFVAEEGMTIGDVYVRDLLAEVESLREQAVDRARLRGLLASMRAAMERGDMGTVAMNIGQLGHHVAEGADHG